MVSHQTVAERLTNNVIDARSSANITFSLEIEYLILVLTNASKDDQLNIPKNLLGAFIDRWIKTMQSNGENLNLLLQDKMTAEQYADLECANYALLHDYISQLAISRNDKSIVLGWLTAIDTDSLRYDGTEYSIDQCQHDTTVRLRKEWFQNKLGIEHIPFPFFYNQREAAKLV